MIQKRVISKKISSKQAEIDHLIGTGELLLQKKKSSFLTYFEKALSLDPNNFSTWFKQGKSLLHSGKLFENKKFIILASRRFKEANKIKNSFICYYYWAACLYELGNLEQESCFFIQAKEKLELASDYLDEASREEKHAFYWTYGKVWLGISQFSEEAIDIKKGLDKFRRSLFYQETNSASFWYDFGKAHVELALLTNENALYLRAIQHFSKSLSQEPNHQDTLAAAADAFTQLYVNTLDEYYFSQADLYFSKIEDPEAEYLIDWAALLTESGKQNKDKHKLTLALNYCIKAAKIDKNHPMLIAQWVETQSYLGLWSNNFPLIEQAELKILDWVEREPYDPDLWYAYGSCLYCLGLYFEDEHFLDIAMEKTQEGLNLNSSCSELWHLAGKIQLDIHCLCDDIRALELANRFLQKAAQLKPKCPAIYFDLAKALTKMGEFTSDSTYFEKSLFYYEQMFSMQKNILLSQPEWLFSYAHTLDLTGNLKEDEKYIIRAVEIYWQLLLLDASYPKIYFRLGSAFVHLGELTSEQAYFEKAFSYFLLATLKDPEHDALWLEWGLAITSFANQISDFKESERMHYYQEAEKKLLQAGRLGSLQSYYHISCLYSLMGKLDLSLSFLQKAKKMDVLPSIQEMLEDEWLYALRETDLFSEFMQNISSKDS
jgi:tetratricopeptide (TPR) repeat protein